MFDLTQNNTEINELFKWFRAKYLYFNYGKNEQSPKKIGSKLIKKGEQIQIQNSGQGQIQKKVNKISNTIQREMVKKIMKMERKLVFTK